MKGQVNMVDRAKVYFTDLRAKPGKNLLDKLKKLVLEAGIKEIDFKIQNCQCLENKCAYKKPE